jgi:hypothetical protein
LKRTVASNSNHELVPRREQQPVTVVMNWFLEENNNQ